VRTILPIQRPVHNQFFDNQTIYRRPARVNPFVTRSPMELSRDTASATHCPFSMIGRRVIRTLRVCGKKPVLGPPDRQHTLDESSKHEYRNPKQFRMTQARISKRSVRRAVAFRSFGLCALDLFRISCFEFRICRPSEGSLMPENLHRHVAPSLLICEWTDAAGIVTPAKAGVQEHREKPGFPLSPRSGRGHVWRE